MNSSPLPSPSPTAPARCPTEQALEVIASKWTVHIIYQLDDVRALRFSELKRALGAVTHKELTKQLRRLEQHGLVTRQVFAEVPPRVEYSLTPLGRTLVAPLKGLADWARQHGAAVEACRTSQETKPALLDDETVRVAVA
jgi:DNA-binding HxlR family transcriptional regulator